MNSIDSLMDGDLRTKGKADDVAKKISFDQALFDEVIVGLSSDMPGLRMRTADAIEKASRLNPSLLFAHKKDILQVYAKIEQQEVMWHIAQLIPRLELSRDERRTAVTILCNYFDTSKSNIVKVNALESLMYFGVQSAETHKIAEGYLQKALDSDKPSLIARARKLIAQYHS